MGERSKIFNLRYSPREREEWRAGAKEAGMDLTGWIRFLIDRELQGVLTEGTAGSVYPNTMSSENGDCDDAEDRLPPPGGPSLVVPSVSARLAELPAARREFRSDFKKERKK